MADACWVLTGARLSKVELCLLMEESEGKGMIRNDGRADV